MSAPTFVCSQCNASFVSPGGPPRFCPACGRDTAQQPAAVDPATTNYTCPRCNTSFVSETGPPRFCPSCGHDLTLPVTPPPYVVATPPMVAAGEVPAAVESGRHWGDLIAGAIILLVGAFIALIGVENSGVALAVGLAMMGVVVVGFLVSGGYKSYANLPGLLRFVVRLPAYCFAALGLVTVGVVEQLIKRKVYGRNYDHD